MIHPFTPPLRDTVTSIVGPVLADCLTLWINHMLASEPAAAQRLVRHSGRRVVLRADVLPSWLPTPPVLMFGITPAGLLEWIATDADASPAEVADDLHMSFDVSNPAQAALDWLNGHRPNVTIQGDAAFAADLHWVVENLQWDVQADLSRLFGPVAAEGLARAGQGIAAALRAAAQAAATLAAGANGSPSR